MKRYYKKCYVASSEATVEGWYYRFGKRPLDIALGTTALFFLSPLMLLISLGIWFTIGSQVLFKQVRPGLNGKPFTIYKYLYHIPPYLPITYNVYTCP
ncbi:MAG TPA: hypothetical protein EYP03_01580 [Aquificae bacterium]|nr:hypothetical protein [Aquificota bacterium]